MRQIYKTMSNEIAFILFSTLAFTTMSIFNVKGFLLVFIIVAVILNLQWDSTNKFFLEVFQEGIKPIVFFLLSAIALFYLSIFIISDLGDLLLLESLFLFFITIILVVLQSFDLFRDNFVITLMLPSKKSMSLRILFIYYLLLSFLPYLFLIPGGGQLVIDIKSIAYFFFFLLFLTFLIILAVPTVNKFTSKLFRVSNYDSKIFKSDMTKLAFSLIFASLLLLINSKIVYSLTPSFFVDYLSTENVNIDFSFILLASIIGLAFNTLVYYGQSSLAILDKLSLHDRDQGLPKKYIILFILLLTYLVVSLPILSLSEWYLINILLIEGIFIIGFFGIQNSSPSPHFSTIQNLLTVFLVLTMVPILISDYFNTFDFDSFFLSFSTLFSLLMNYIIMNRYFVNFNFTQMLKSTYKDCNSQISKEEVMKIILIESVDLVPNGSKFDCALKIVDIFKRSNECSILSSIKSELKSLETNYDMVRKGEEWSIREKIKLLGFYVQITELYYIMDLPLSSYLGQEILLDLATIKSEDFVSLGVLVHTFFEAFIKSIRMKMGLSLHSIPDESKNIEDHDNIKQSGFPVVSKLDLPKKTIKRIQHERNQYIHRKQEKLGSYGHKKHYENITRVLSFSIEILKRSLLLENEKTIVRN